MKLSPVVPDPVTIEFTDTMLADRGVLRPVRRLLLRAGRIERIDVTGPDDAVPASPPKRILTPGMIDLHVHGIAQSAVEQGPDALRAAARAMPAFGVTRAFPTLVPGKAGGMKGFLERLAGLSGALESLSGARMPGFHVEGPFVAKAGAACATLPGDVGLLDEIVAASRNQVRIMSLAPDVPNILPVIERLLEHGIVPFVTHTQADADSAQAAIEAGARHATHFYDVFYAPEATDPGVRPAGVVEAFLADPRCTVDFIADGTHVHPLAIRATLQAKGIRGVALITDGNIGAGMPPGIYETPWGYPIEVGTRGGARIADRAHPSFGSLAGSSLTLDQAVRNLCGWFGMPFEQAIVMATETPARVARQQAGRLVPGLDADLVLWESRDGKWMPVKTWVGGVEVSGYSG